MSNAALAIAYSQSAPLKRALLHKEEFLALFSLQAGMLSTEFSAKTDMHASYNIQEGEITGIVAFTEPASSTRVERATGSSLQVVPLGGDTMSNQCPQLL